MTTETNGSGVESAIALPHADVSPRYLDVRQLLFQSKGSGFAWHQFTRRQFQQHAVLNERRSESEAFSIEMRGTS